MESQELTALLQLGTTGALFAWFIYQYFQTQKVKNTLKDSNTDKKNDTTHVASELKQHENKDEIDIALLKQKQLELETNHLKHQEAIEEWMGRITCVMVKVAGKLDIDTDELFK